MRKIEIQSHLENAINDDEQFLLHQPQIDSQGKFYGVEALARWNNVDLGFIPSYEFIGIAEHSGYIIRIGDYLLEKALTELQEIQELSKTEFSISINISVKQFLREGFIEKLNFLISKTGINRFTLTLEITENIFIDDLNYLLPLLSRIRDIDLKISLDDFCTGYSSLSMLRNSLLMK